MTVEKITISLESELVREVREVAEGNISAWLAQAARTRLRQILAQRLLEEYEQEHGEIQEDELEEVQRLWQD